LRNDIGKNRGVTTLVEAGIDLERGAKRPGMGSLRGRRESVDHLAGTEEWNQSESKLTEVSSEDGQSWGSGIRKTTVSTQNVG
jgi:hypothetical protein